MTTMMLTIIIIIIIIIIIADTAGWCSGNVLNFYFGVHRFDLSRKFGCPDYRFSWFS